MNQNTLKQITIIDSIRQIPKDQWNKLAEDTVYATYGWLLTVEESYLKQVIPKYFLFKEAQRIEGAAVCYLVPKNVRAFSSNDLLFGRLKKWIGLLGISFLPTMVCSPINAYGKHVLCKKDLDPLKKEKVVEILLTAVEKEAQKQRVSLSFSRVLKQEKLVIHQLRQRGYFETLDLPNAYMDISWDSFEDYKETIRKKSLNMRKNIAKEINKNRRSGVKIEKVTDLNGQEKRLYELLNRNSLKHNNLSFPFGEYFLGRLKKNLGDDLVINRSLKNGRISGGVVLLKKEDTGYLPFVGIDYNLAQNDATFFNMVFYRPITEAIADNMKRLYFGNGFYDMKIRRGCKIQKAYFFYKPFNAISKPLVGLWLWFHSCWHNKKMFW